MKQEHKRLLILQNSQNWPSPGAVKIPYFLKMKTKFDNPCKAEVFFKIPEDQS